MSDYLLFSLNTVHYAVDISAVREILWLPELTSIEEAPAYIAGVINLRGQILPVMSLDQRFQHPQKPIQLTDRVIVLQIAEVSMGILVTDVLDVAPIDSAEIFPLPRYHRHPDTSQHFILGEANVNGCIWMLLDLNNLIDMPDLVEHSLGLNDSHFLFRDLPPKELQLFQARAQRLGQQEITEINTEHEAFAIFRLGNELYAVAVDSVSEFCHFQQFTPIPCCPDYFVGNMNLRGDILTLIDIRSMLGTNRDTDLAEVMVAEVDGLRVGLLVSEVLDVIYQCQQRLSLQGSLQEHAHEYCKNAIQYAGQIAGILDIKALLTQGDLEVNEEV